MNVSPAKENILKKIRKALSDSTPLPFPKSEGSDSVFQPDIQEKEIEFAEQFTKLQGRFIFCINQQELAFQLNSLVKKMDWQKVFCLEKDLLKIAGPQLTERIVKTGLASCDVSIGCCDPGEGCSSDPNRGRLRCSTSPANPEESDELP